MLSNQIEEILKSKELEMLRAVNEERERFDNREERLLRRITELEGRLQDDGRRKEETRGLEESALTTEESLGETVLNTQSDTYEPRPKSGEISGTEGPVGGTPNNMFAQLPPLAAFKGAVGPDAEDIDE